MQAKDIPDGPVLQFLDSLRSPATWLENDGTLFENSVQHGMPIATPRKIVLAKNGVPDQTWLGRRKCLWLPR